MLQEPSTSGKPKLAFAKKHCGFRDVDQPLPWEKQGGLVDQ